MISPSSVCVKGTGCEDYEVTLFHHFGFAIDRLDIIAECFDDVNGTIALWEIV